jgi:hypothetical protein
VGNEDGQEAGENLAFRVALPDRTRAIAVILLVAGIALLDESGFHGPLAWIGGLVFCVGVGFIDGLEEGRLGGRQAGVVLFLVGLAAAAWSLVVIFLTHFFLEEGVPPLLYGLLVGGVAALLAGVRMRWPASSSVTWPRTVLARFRAGVGSHRDRAAA